MFSIIDIPRAECNKVSEAISMAKLLLNNPSIRVFAIQFGKQKYRIRYV